MNDKKFLIRSARKPTPIITEVKFGDLYTELLSLEAQIKTKLAGLSVFISMFLIEIRKADLPEGAHVAKYLSRILDTQECIHAIAKLREQNMIPGQLPMRGVSTYMSEPTQRWIRNYLKTHGFPEE